MIRLYPQPGDSPWVEAVLADDVAYALAAKATTAAAKVLGISPDAATRERMTDRITLALGTLGYLSGLIGQLSTPLATVRFSTTTETPSFWPSHSEARRPMPSVTPPGAKGTSTRSPA